jgi:hypothetical protein
MPINTHAYRPTLEWLQEIDIRKVNAAHPFSTALSVDIKRRGKPGGRQPICDTRE